MKQIIIAGTCSGAGKTTISIGIMKALSMRGYRVIPFKVGPDYIDAGFHKVATRISSVNLDLWMAGENNTKFIYENNRKNGDFAVTEGVMGLYDGLGDPQATGSTAHIAKVLGIPVILVIDGEKTGSSAAATVLGFKEYDKEVNIAGVIVNRVSSESHYMLINDAILRKVGIPCLGFLPPDPAMSIPSRHLGLVPQTETESSEEIIEKLARLIVKNIDLDRVERIAQETRSRSLLPDPRANLRNIGKGLRIGIAMDDAFSFYYRDNIELLEYMGMELIYFSPLRDVTLPLDLDGLYLGGGFPEMFAQKLSSNNSFLRSIHDAMENGLPVYAECGGYMYLTKGIVDLEENYHSMVGFLKGFSRMTKKLHRFGYAEITDGYGNHFRGHEFHHSEWMGSSSVLPALSLTKPSELHKDIRWACGQRKGNVHGAYAHIHFYSNLEAVGRICESLVKIKESKNGEIRINEKK